MQLKKKQNNVEVVWKPIPNSSQSLALDTRCDHTLYHGTRGPGKDLELSTLVLTDKGWVKAGDITYNHRLVAIDGSFTKILGIFPKSNRHMRRVEFHDGSFVIADSEHNWLVLNGKTGYREGGWKVRTTDQIMKASVPYSVPYMQGAVEGTLEWNGPDPYLVGLLLGDGTMRSARVTLYSADQEILDYAKNNEGWNQYQYEGQIGRVCCPERQSSKWRDIMPSVTAGFKSVPDDLMKASPDDRLSVLQGLMDSDGSIETNGKMRFVSLSERLARNVHDLAWSLGGNAVMYWEDRSSLLGGVNGRWRVTLSHNNKFVPFRLERKRNRVGVQKKFLTRGIKSIVDCGMGDGVCFAIEHPSHCYVIKDFVVTHNTITQLMRYRRRVGLGYGSFWRGIIFDREFKNLGDLVAQSKRFFPRFDDGAKFLESASDYKWVWPTGEELLFRHAKKLADYENFHGHEYPFIGWNELTKWPTGELYDKVNSTNRSSFLSDGTLPPIPLEVFSTTNPSGPGHNWVKRRFINPAENGEVVRKEVLVFNPQTQQEEIVVKTQVAIFGSYRENIYLDPKYIASLDELTASDSNLRAAWLYGSWDVTAGGAFDDLWKKSVHVVPRFQIPASWRVDRSFDWGSSHPFSVGWWAEANGEEAILPDGSTWCPASGSLIRIAEWYGTKEIGTNKGLKLSAGDIAEGIKQREIELLKQEWICNQPWPGPADNQIRDTRENDVDTIEKKMADKGIRWTKSDKSPGSRIIGLQLARDMLENALRGEGPALYVMNNCQAFVEVFPSLPRDEDKIDDVSTDAEDHSWDETRYRVLKGKNRLARKIDLKFAM